METAEQRIDSTDEVGAVSMSPSTSLLARDHEELIRRFCAYRYALDYCLAMLKHHHMTKRGIPTLVKKTEQIKRKANDQVEFQEGSE